MGRMVVDEQASDRSQGELRIRRCTSCGAAVEFPAAAVSVTCGYCTSPLVDAERATLSVDRVAPFRVTRERARQKLQELVRGHFWAPGAVKNGMQDQSVLRGVLVPFYVYSGVARSRFDAQVGIHYQSTEAYVDSKGKTRTRKRTHTEWFPHNGSAILAFEDQLVSASAGLPESKSNSLEPFDLGRAMPFDVGLVSGWEAELPSLERERADHTAQGEVKALEARRVARTLLPGDVGKVSGLETDLTVQECDVVLLPIWIATFKYREKVFRHLVNGQTGKVIGEVPVSRARVRAAIAIGLGLFAALVLLGHFS